MNTLSPYISPSIISVDQKASTSNWEKQLSVTLKPSRTAKFGTSSQLGISIDIDRAVEVRGADNRVPNVRSAKALGLPSTAVSLHAHAMMRPHKALELTEGGPYLPT